MKKLKRAIQIFCLILFSIFIFDQFVTKYFHYTLIGYGGLVHSNSKKEAIKRGTYLFDVKLPNSPYKINNSMELEIKEGWVEKSWRTGPWYWDTRIDSNSSCGYFICFTPSKKSEEFSKWKLKQKRFGKYKGYSTVFAYNDGTFSDRLDELPSNDTIKVFAVLDHNAHFNDSTDNTYILGELKLVIKRK